MAVLGVLAVALWPADTVVGAIIGAGAIVVAFALVAAARSTHVARRPRAATGRVVARQHDRTRRAVRRAGKWTYTELEALLWLRDALRLERPLRPTRGTAAAPDLLLELVRAIDRLNPKLVVELGSGVSTIVIARRLQQLGEGVLVALEHETRYADATREELDVHGLGAWARVVHAPLGDVASGDRVLRWYQVPPGTIEGRIDLLFVDGPPGGSGPLARYPALPILRPHLAPGAFILMDDGDRPDETGAVQRWQSEVEGLEARHLRLEAGAWAIRMPG